MTEKPGQVRVRQSVGSPVDDDGVRRRLVPVSTALLITAAAATHRITNGSVNHSPHLSPVSWFHLAEQVRLLAELRTFTAVQPGLTKPSLCFWSWSQVCASSVRTV